jgi:hypothetical protein
MLAAPFSLQSIDYLPSKEFQKCVARYDGDFHYVFCSIDLSRK